MELTTLELTTLVWMFHKQQRTHLLAQCAVLNTQTNLLMQKESADGQTMVLVCHQLMVLLKQWVVSGIYQQLISRYHANFLAAAETVSIAAINERDCHTIEGVKEGTKNEKGEWMFGATLWNKVKETHNKIGSSSPHAQFGAQYLSATQLRYAGSIGRGQGLLLDRRSLVLVLARGLSLPDSGEDSILVAAGADLTPDLTCATE
eukprot:2035737-Amphidinium_carterae.1